MENKSDRTYTITKEELELIDGVLDQARRDLLTVYNEFRGKRDPVYPDTKDIDKARIIVARKLRSK